MKNTVSDIQLQKQLRADDKVALEKVYTDYRDEFLNYSKRYKIEDSDVLDIYQDAVIAMHQNFVTNQLVLTKSTIKTYLFGIGKNKIFKFLKNQNKLVRKSVVNDEFDEIKIDEDNPTAIQIKLSENLKLISESCQDILKLFYYRNLTIDEIVAQTDYKDSNTVRSHKSRCMKRLKTLFKVV